MNKTLKGLGLGLVLMFFLAGSPVQATHPGGSDILMLEGSLHTHSGGPTTSVEYLEAIGLGFTVDVVDDVEWAALTATEFASYQAIVLGDPHCVGTTSGISAAEANDTVWVPQVTGNVIIIGTDPEYHKTQGGDKLTRHGINFAASGTTTGAYITLSCYYGGVPQNAPINPPVLDQFGTFAVAGQQFQPTTCPNDMRIVAAHPALDPLLESDLSNWSCSLHEGFHSIPSDFNVLALSVDPGSPQIFGPVTDRSGNSVTGYPHIIARGVTPIGCEALSQGYWHRQCKATGEISHGASLPPLLQDNFADLKDDVDPQLALLTDPDQDTCEALDASPPRDPCEKALKQYTALLLNIADGRLTENCETSLGTIGELLAQAEAAIASWDKKACNQIKSLIGEAIDELESDATGGGTHHSGGPKPKGGE